MMAKASHGINPVTFRGIDNRTHRPTALSLLRAHIGISGNIKKLVTAVMFDDPGGPESGPREAEIHIQGFVVLDEDHFLAGLYHIFPQGQMDHADSSPVPLNSELIEGLKMAVAALRSLGASEASLIGLVTLLHRVEG